MGENARSYLRHHMGIVVKLWTGGREDRLEALPIRRRLAQSKNKILMLCGEG
jgi:hypothetical protein